MIHHLKIRQGDVLRVGGESFELASIRASADVEVLFRLASHRLFSGQRHEIAPGIIIRSAGFRSVSHCELRLRTSLGAPSPS